MIDIKITHTKEFAKVTSIGHLNQDHAEQLGLYKKGDILPIIFVINGENFSEAKKVLINTREVEFYIVSSKRLFAFMPANWKDLSLDEVYVITDSKRYSSSSLLVYELGQWGTVGGPEKVVSQFIKLLMTTPGTDSFEPHLGAGLLKFPGQGLKYPADIAVKVTTAIVRAADHYRLSQMGNSSLKSYEKLENAKIISMDHNAVTHPGDFYIWLKIDVQSGQSIPVQLQVAGDQLLKSIASGEFTGGSSGGTPVASTPKTGTTSDY
jgi:hypothetical protein